MRTFKSFLLSLLTFLFVCRNCGVLRAPGNLQNHHMNAVRSFDFEYFPIS